MHCIHLRKVHRCVQCAMCNSPVTWMCQLFVATAILSFHSYHPLDRLASAAKPFCIIPLKSRESLVGGKRLPLSVKCLYILLKCHGTWAFFMNLLLYWSSRSRHTEHNVWNCGMYTDDTHKMRAHTTYYYCMCEARARVKNRIQLSHIG